MNTESVVNSEILAALNNMEPFERQERVRRLNNYLAALVKTPLSLGHHRKHARRQKYRMCEDCIRGKHNFALHECSCVCSIGERRA